MCSMETQGWDGFHKPRQKYSHTGMKSRGKTAFKADFFFKKIIILACGFEFVKAQKEMVSIQFVGEWTAAQLRFILMN